MCTMVVKDRTVCSAVAATSPQGTRVCLVRASAERILAAARRASCVGAPQLGGCARARTVSRPLFVRWPTGSDLETLISPIASLFIVQEHEYQRQISGY